MNRSNNRSFNVTKTNSRYTRGGTSDVYNTRVGWWERAILPHDPSDVFFDVDNKTQHRPDLISYQMYGTSSYAWMVLQFNNIVDINEELVQGTVLKLPTPSRLNTILLSNSPGGIKKEG